MHLRRPSRLSTLDLPDTQPFDDPEGRFAFSHNGDLRDYRGPRERYRGRAASSGARTARSASGGSRTPGRATARPETADGSDDHVGDRLAALHAAFGGEANLAVLTGGGTPHHYAGNPENPVFAFRLGRIGIASTAIYSIDRSVFRYAASGATNRSLVRLHTTVTLDAAGMPVVVARGEPVSA